MISVKVRPSVRSLAGAFIAPPHPAAAKWMLAVHPFHSAGSQFPSHHPHHTSEPEPHACSAVISSSPLQSRGRLPTPPVFILSRAHLSCKHRQDPFRDHPCLLPTSDLGKISEQEQQVSTFMLQEQPQKEEWVNPEVGRAQLPPEGWGDSQVGAR